MDPTMTGQTISKVEHFPPSYVDLFCESGGLLRIENDFVLERPGQPTLRTEDSSEVELEVVAFLETLVGTRVEAMDTPDGGLVLTLAQGVKVVAEPSRDFESWEYVGASGERLLSAPGGRLVVWGPS